MQNIANNNGMKLPISIAQRISTSRLEESLLRSVRNKKKVQAANRKQITANTLFAMSGLLPSRIVDPSTISAAKVVP